VHVARHDQLLGGDQATADPVVGGVRRGAGGGLLGELRGEPAVDRSKLIDVLVGLSEAATADDRIVSADLNPLIVVDGVPLAVDALIKLRP
jgi:hypothetical protein